ncbi:NAD(P)-dependent oxidoreductase [Geodermatophilus poikilotrophus]|uniref:NAD(P)-dependent oxidoreductase n=1 Tax=Geodermatophilus poikilotrophus TaxID=1333667 RepID=UPI001587EECD|nr:NAD(P)-binding oxidoreductase [Geodermatophilus poikilotrophus]
MAVLGATGTTGRLLVDELLRRGHTVVALTRAPQPDGPEAVSWVAGDARDAGALAALVRGADAVVSALGPRRSDRTVHREVAPLLVTAMEEAGVRRFVGISGAGIDVPGDRKSRRDRVVSALVQRLGGQTVRDKALEWQTWADSRLDWTLVRPPRLVDGPPTGQVEHSAHHSPRRTSIPRADLAAFLADLVDRPDYVQQAPLVAGR